MAMQSFRQRLETKQGIGIVIALLSGGVLVYLFLTPWALRKLSDGFYLGFFNMLSMGLLLLMGLGLAADKHRKEVPEELKTLTLRGFLGVLVLAAGCLLYFEVMRRIGFLVIPDFLVHCFSCSEAGTLVEVCCPGSGGNGDSLSALQCRRSAVTPWIFIRGVTHLVQTMRY